MMTKTEHHYDETYGLKPPENYERFFVPTIGEPLAKDLIQKADLHLGERVLDVACGTGIIARLALNDVGNKGTVTGMDINPGMLAVARSITKDLPIDWLKASAEKMPFSDESFDIVICQLGLQFMENRAKALQEIHRVLVPGGRLALNVPGPAGKPFAILAENLKRYISPKAKEFVDQVFVLNDIGEIRELIHGPGFRNVNIQTYNKILPLPVPEDFFWQYVQSTPLSGILAEADEGAKALLEKEVVDQWQEFLDDTVFNYQQRIVTVSAMK